jgi:ABC-type branched-subunit amino acid transport system ATPase component
MLSVLQIEGFRAFSQYTVEDLGRINLFVGRNNSGKTTILEAAELLLVGDSPDAVIGCAMRRGEIYVQKEHDRPGRYVDVSHLFYGHTPEVGARFHITGTEDGAPLSLECRVEPIERGESIQQSFPFDIDKQPYRGERGFEPVLSLSIQSGPEKEPCLLPMALSGAVSYDAVRRLSPRPSREEKPVSFVRTEALDAVELQEFWDSIALTEEEANVIESLRILEPRLERIAFLGSRSYRFGPSSGGIFLRLAHLEKRIPLGSLGDGMRHLLTLSLAVGHAPRGFVMVDEIDTGLHHSVMSDMWRVLIASAERLDAQLFVTTHSLDCVRSLAWLAYTQPELCKGVRMHRVDSERSRTVVYAPKEISIAAEQHVEMRG